MNFLDLAYVRSVFLSNDHLADLNRDGLVNFQDLELLRTMFF
ncbi:MAG: hypothetical protein KJO98_15190, partial [Rhodothermia bacterium]|nr:hypothetical protein [Rhodothermia bacterium]